MQATLPLPRPNQSLLPNLVHEHVLEVMGGPKLTSVFCLLRACAARTAFRAKALLRALRLTLAEAAEQADLLGWARGSFSPAFWNWPSCSEYLLEMIEPQGP